MNIVQLADPITDSYAVRYNIQSDSFSTCSVGSELPGRGMSVQQIYRPRAGKKGNEVSGIQLSYYTPASTHKYMDSNIENLNYALTITVECNTTATLPLYNGLATFNS